MKLGRAEFIKLRGSILLCVGLIGVGAAMVVLTQREMKRAGRDLIAAELKQRQSETRLRQVSNEELEIKQKSALFQDLRERGVIGAENRLDWVELLREVRDRQKLYAVDYEISPQQKLEGSAGGYEFQSSNMRLALHLLHEEDLLRALTDLRRNARALLLPRDCVLTRLPRGTGETRGPQAQLKADCSLQWVTIRAPREKS